MAETPETNKLQHQPNASTQTFGPLALILKTLEMLCETLNEPVSDSRHRMMAEDLSDYSMVEVLGVLADWRTGQIPSLPISDLRFFPKTPQVVRIILERRNVAVERESSEALLEVFAVIRIHTVDLKPTGGVIIRDRDDDGRLLASPIRSPRIPFPGFPKAIDETLERMGWGDAKKGLEVVAAHPAVSSEVESGGWMLKTADQIEKRWRECWK